MFQGIFAGVPWAQVKAAFDKVNASMSYNSQSSNANTRPATTTAVKSAPMVSVGSSFSSGVRVTISRPSALELSRISVQASTQLSYAKATGNVSAMQTASQTLKNTTTISEMSSSLSKLDASVDPRYGINKSLVAFESSDGKRSDTDNVFYNPGQRVEVDSSRNVVTQYVPPSPQLVQVLNDGVEEQKLQYINASVRGDVFSEQQTKSDADVLRSKGATMSSDQTTPATNALQRYYTSDSTVKTALQTKNVNDLNQVIVKAKNDYQWAQAHGDQAGMLAAKYLADNMRNMGGTIGSDVSLADAIRIANAPSPKPAPLSTPTPAVPETPVATEADKSVLSKAWDGVQWFLGVNEIKDGWNKLTSQNSTWQERLDGAGILVANGLLDASMVTGAGEGAKLAETAAKAGWAAGKEYFAKMVAKESVVSAKGLSQAEQQQILRQRAVEVRGQLPSVYKAGNGNVGVAKLEIQGLPSELKAYSTINEATDPGASGFVLLRENRVFDTKVVDKYGRVDSSIGYDRKFDTESKILEEVAARLGNNPKATGKIDLYTERYACQSCTDVILAFRQKYPNIQLNVFAN